MKVRFQGSDHEVQFARYPNGRIRIVLGDNYATATANVPDAELSDRQVLIKDYSENEGILAALEEAGIIKVTGEAVESGYATMAVCEIIVPIPEKQAGAWSGRFGETKGSGRGAKR